MFGKKCRMRIRDQSNNIAQYLLSKEKKEEPHNVEY